MWRLSTSVLDVSPMPPMPPPDNTATIVAFVPAVILTVDPPTADPRYRGARRRRGWRSIPIGAAAVVVVILLVTGIVSMQLLTGRSSPRPDNHDLLTAPTPLLPPVGSVAPGPGKASAAPSPSLSHTTSHRPSPRATTAPAAPPSAVVSAPTSAPAFAPAQVGGRFSGIGGKCVQAGVGGRAQLQTCSGAATQQWSRPGDGTVRSQGACLDVAGAATADETIVQLYACNSTVAQQWVSGSGGTLRNPNAGRCLDAQYASSADGTQLIIWDCSAAANQQWQLS
jgi:Ricin-type beta-trefoil lectin domain